ncbi:2-haloalkanoic acid dehalogenase [Methylobacterium indicum]|uniref:2-haloalkanoic acid dehalogenase n=1 Tax=Methylobacterium indicum TaxID=1775910 RepID=A0A8H8WZC5_9HYPH|nr:HAD-IA family hydrolase [Methylobacterium indicum]KTS35027.1 2-haloalkanoic acid dehalogenase [Methylobacterium indicum]KTS36222.1 2-haloalkanoic acid dehalogenase [Methylobacterium indicum]KTS54155.1 2-haloalkanoic acid dehalogenase [Methylobacterium indicum]BCM87195.1 2-haloalkanoic acid dehalogenase [Methylobacterium indicum]
MPAPSLDTFKVLTFDVVGTLIDFEKGILDHLRAVSGRSQAELSDATIFASYLKGRELNYERSSEVFADVYRHVARDLGFPNTDADADAFQLSVLRWPAFADSVAALKRLRKHYRLVAMTNADRSAFSFYSHTLGSPFHDGVTYDDTGVAKPNPQFFAFNRGRQSALGYKQSDILHVAQSQYHDIGIARDLGYTVCWIERRQGLEGFGGTPEPERLTTPDYHFPTLEKLADAADAAFAAAARQAA